MRIAGYASLFGVADDAGDVVRAGAFRATLIENAEIAMLVRHDPRLVAGRWRAFEDRRGLYVEGAINERSAAGALALRLIERGMDGLSIGFTAKRARRLPGGGRELIEVTLWEVSLVSVPMLREARFSRLEPAARAA